MAAVISVPCPADAACEPDDDCLLTRFSAGERTALEELFRRYRQPAYRVAYRLLGNEADALDAVQEGFVKALTHLASFQRRSSFKTWLLRVVSNAALDLGRQRGRRECLSLEAAEVHDADLSLLLVPDETSARLDRSELRREIDQALLTLSDAQRQTFVLNAEAGLSYREVAEVMNISIGTVMSRLFYARQKLRTYLAHKLSSRG
jgi:RNA polymerase sigma-70 factor (ECF subfamily)